MRSILAALAIGLFATAAHAEVLGTIPPPPGSVNGYLPGETTCGQVFTWQATLSAGKDYAFRVFFGHYGTATLHTASGAAVMSFPVIESNEDYGTGHEARVPYTGTYFLDIRLGEPSCTPGTPYNGDGNGYGITYEPDCLGGRRTQ